MIVARAPYRISLLGGGTDFPEYFTRRGKVGRVLSFTLGYHCWVFVKRLPPFFPSHRTRVVWSEIEQVARHDEVRHPAVRACLSYLGFDAAEGLEIHHAGDLPARSGVGSSSAFTVATLTALHALQGDFVDQGTLAREAIAVEQTVLKEAVGCQDQVAAAFGGLNAIEFRGGGGNGSVQFQVGRVWATPPGLFEWFLLFHTGATRSSADIVSSYRPVSDREAELDAMGALVGKGAAALRNRDFVSFGRLVGEGWQLKQSFSCSVCPDWCERLYNMAIGAGAAGGKLTGSGGGGFLFLVVPPSKQPAVREALRDLTEVPVTWSDRGAEVFR